MLPTPGVSGGTTAEALRAELVDVVRGVDELDVRSLEGESAPVVSERLRTPILDALRESLRVLKHVLRRYDGAAEPPPPLADTADAFGRDFDHGVDAIVRQRPSAGRVADLGFMASMELTQRLDRIESLEAGDDPWRLLSVLDSARRRMRKSLGAVEAMLCQVEGLEPQIGHASELAESLEVRRVYARLRRSIDASAEPTDEELRARLRGAGTQIAILIGRPIYPQLRIDDRAQLRALQARILAHLRRPEDDPRTCVEARRLWQDLSGFGQVLGQVSNRQELLEHDARVVAIALGACASSRRRAVPERLFERLLELMGIDAEVDALLAERVLDVDRWRPPLRRLARRFGLRVDPPPARPREEPRR